MNAPDLTRCSGDGFTVTARYVPTLRNPVLCTVSVSKAGAVVDVRTVPAVDGSDVWRHPAVYLPAYRETLCPL